MDENMILQIRENIKEQIMITILKYDLKNYTTEYFDEFIDELFDVSKSKVLNINEYKTYILRKRFGILDNGKEQMPVMLSQDLDKTRQAVVITIRKSIMKIVSYSNEMYIVDMLRNGKIDGKDIDIEDLDLSLYSYNYLMRKNFSNVGMMCEFCTDELRGIISSEKVFKEMYDKINSLGLCFLDERENKKVKRLEKY